MAVSGAARQAPRRSLLTIVGDALMSYKRGANRARSPRLGLWWGRSDMGLAEDQARLAAIDEELKSIAGALQTESGYDLNSLRVAALGAIATPPNDDPVPSDVVPGSKEETRLLQRDKELRAERAFIQSQIQAAAWEAKAAARAAEQKDAAGDLPWTEGSFPSTGDPDMDLILGVGPAQRQPKPPTTEPKPPTTDKSFDPDHYDDAHSFGWNQNKPPPDTARVDGPDTGHYDDAHSFGWTQRKVSIGGKEFSMRLIAGAAAVLAGAIGVAVTIGHGNGGATKPAASTQALPEAPPSGAGLPSNGGGTASTGQFLASDSSTLIAFEPAPACRSTYRIHYSGAGAPVSGSAVFATTGPGIPSSFTKPWSATGSTFELSFPLSASPRRWTVQLASVDAATPANKSFATFSYADKSGTLGC